MIQIALGAVIVAFGAFVTQQGWNNHGEARERIATIANLAHSIEANRKVLAFTARAAEKYKTPSIITKSGFPPTEAAVLANALSQGVFLDKKYKPLLIQMRNTHTAWAYYNQSSTGSLVDPDKVKGDTEWAQKETETLAEMLVKGFGQTQLQLEARTND